MNGMQEHPLAIGYNEYLEKWSIPVNKRPRPDLIIAVRRGTEEEKRNGLLVDVSFTTDRHALLENDFKFGDRRSKKNWRRWDNKGVKVAEQDRLGVEARVRRSRKARDKRPMLQQRLKEIPSPPVESLNRTKTPTSETNPEADHKSEQESSSETDQWWESNTRKAIARGETRWGKGGSHKTSQDVPDYYPRARYVNKYWELARHVGQNKNAGTDVLVVLLGVNGTVPKRTMEIMETLMYTSQGTEPDEPHHPSHVTPPQQPNGPKMTKRGVLSKMTAIAHQTVLKVHEVWKGERQT